MLNNTCTMSTCQIPYLDHEKKKSKVIKPNIKA